jgi:hypothetical protein
MSLRQDGFPSRWDQYAALLKRRRDPERARSHYLRFVEAFLYKVEQNPVAQSEQGDEHYPWSWHTSPMACYSFVHSQVTRLQQVNSPGTLPIEGQ